MTRSEVRLIVPILRREAWRLRRRHSSDGLFQNRYTPSECDAFKEDAERIEAFCDRLQDAARTEDATINQEPS